MQLTIFENILTTGEMAYSYQFLIMPHCVQLYSVNILSFGDNFHGLMFSTSSGVYLLYVWTGKEVDLVSISETNKTTENQNNNFETELVKGKLQLSSASNVLQGVCIRANAIEKA